VFAVFVGSDGSDVNPLRTRLNPRAVLSLLVRRAVMAPVVELSEASVFALRGEGDVEGERT